MYILIDWGQGQINHKKVCEINNELKNRGLLTWLDEERMTGNVQEKMTMGIDDSTIVVTFITQNYMDKVNGKNAGDNCKLEFRYCCSRKTSSKMLAVVMEAGVRATNKWSGAVGMNLGGELYVDMADDQHLESDKIDELYNRIIAMTGEPLKGLFDHLIESVLKDFPLIESLEFPQSPTSPISQVNTSLNNVNLNNNNNSNDIDEAGNNQINEMISWFVNSAGLVPKAAEKIANLVFNMDIGRIDRLARKIKRNRDFLKKFEIDEDDEEDIIAALEKESNVDTPTKSLVSPTITPTITPSDKKKEGSQLPDIVPRTTSTAQSSTTKTANLLVGTSPVQISGAIGSGSTINGIYEPSGEFYEGVTVYRKRGDPLKWLEYGMNSKIYIFYYISLNF
jgi:hypothetical protein